MIVMIDGMNSKETKLSLFDDGSRNPEFRRSYTTPSFNDINLSPDQSAAEARKVLDNWFARIPATKKADIRGRFRGDDRQHSGALLELLMHELTWQLCDWVRIDPNVDGTTPDFLAGYRGAEFFVECTVAQGSDRVFGALRRERDVLDIVEQVNAGFYGLFLEPQRIGTSTVPRKNLKGFLEQKLATLDEYAPVHDNPVGTFRSEVIAWEWEDWLLYFRPVVVGNRSGKQTVVGQHKGPYIVEDAGVLQRSLEKKADAYPHLDRPYLVVVTQRDGIGNDDDLLSALLGDKIIALSPILGTWDTERSFDGLFGPPSNPRNSHVSGVLYKRNLRSAWAIQNQWTQYDSNTRQAYKESDWTLVHHPTAKYPLPLGIFPFATEYIWELGDTKPIPATQTVNDVLGLPNPWPE